MPERTKITTPPREQRPGTVAAIHARSLRKSYGEQVVLDGIDLEVPAGSVYALLGPNGAGKTTTVQILSTLITADAGTVTVAGHDVTGEAHAVRAAIGVTGQFAAVDELLTGRENLRLMAALRHLDREHRRSTPDRLLDRFDLGEAADKPLSTYSGGMRRRLDLAMTLVGEPKIIFLDEPSAGLDPRSRRALWDIVRGLVRQGVTIFLTTQYLEEADQLADRIAVLDHGRIVAEGTSAELKKLVPGGQLHLRFEQPEHCVRAESALTSATTRTEDLVVALPTDGSTRSLRRTLDQLDRAGLEPESLSLQTPDLDDVFLTLTGHPTEQDPSTTEDKQ